MKAIQQSPNDWTFIIKIHALIEVALNHMLAGQFKQGWFGLNRPEVSTFVEHFPLHGKTGKIAFARALGLMSKGPASFISLVSRLRGLLVHDIKNFDFDLVAHLKTLKPEDLEQWKTGLTFNLGEQVEEKFRQFSVEFPHFAIWNGCMSIFALSFAAQPLDTALLYRNMLAKIQNRQDQLGPADQKFFQTPRESIPTKEQ
jgi:hypothetical protein